MDEHTDISAHALNARVLRFRSESDGEPAVPLARQLMAAGRYGDARGVLILAQDRCDAAALDPTLWLIEGDAWMAEGDHGRAVACYMRVARIAPRDARGFLAMAGALLERNDLLRADKALERCLALTPEDDEALALKVRIDAARAAKADAAAPADVDEPIEIEVDLDIVAAEPEPAAVEAASAQQDAEPYAVPLEPGASSAPAEPSVVGDTSPGLGIAPSGAPPASLLPIDIGAPAPIGAAIASGSSAGLLAAVGELSPSTAGAIDAMTPLSTGTLGGETPSSAGTVEAVSPSSAGILAAPSLESSPGTLSAMGSLDAPTPITSAGLESSPGLLSSPGTMASVGQLGASTAAAATWLEQDLHPAADGSDDETSGVNELPQDPGADAGTQARGPVDLEPEAIEEIADSMDQAFAAYERTSTPPPIPPEALATSPGEDLLEDESPEADGGVEAASVEDLVADELADAPAPEVGSEAIWVPTPMDLAAAEAAPSLRLDPEISGPDVITKAPVAPASSPWATVAIMALLGAAGYFGFVQWQVHGETWAGQARAAVERAELPTAWLGTLVAGTKAEPAPEPVAAAKPAPEPTAVAPEAAEPVAKAPEAVAPVVPEAPVVQAPAAPAEPRGGDRASLAQLRQAAAGGKDATALVRYGDALYRTDRVNKAAGVYDAALAIDATHVGALIGRAEVHLRAERPSDALALLKQANSVAGARLASQPRARLLGLLGHAHLQRGQAGDRRAARRALEKAVELPTANIDSFFWLGESLAGRHTSRAADAYQRYLQKAPHGKYATRAKRALGPLL